MAYSALASMQAHHPNFVYSIFEDGNVSIIEAVQKDLADVGLLSYKPEKPLEGLVVECVRKEPYVAWVHKDNPLPDTVETPEALIDYVLLQSISRRFENWNDACLFRFKRMGLTPKKRIKNVNFLAEFFCCVSKG